MDEYQLARPVARGQCGAAATEVERLPVQHFDADRYRHHLAHLEMTASQKDDMLEVVWAIMRSFVDRAFGHDAVQLAKNSGDEGATAEEGRTPQAVDSASPSNTNNSDLVSAFAKAGRGD